MQGYLLGIAVASYRPETAVARISFDSLTHADHVVELGGDDYEFPGDPPIPLIIELEQAVKALMAAGEDGATEEHVEAIYEALFALFRVCKPELERLPVGTRALVPLALAVMNPERYIAGEGSDEDPTVPQPPAGTPKRTSSSPKAKSKGKTRTSTS